MCFDLIKWAWQGGGDRFAKFKIAKIATAKFIASEKRAPYGSGNICSFHRTKLDLLNYKYLKSLLYTQNQLSVYTLHVYYVQHIKKFTNFLHSDSIKSSQQVSILNNCEIAKWRGAAPKQHASRSASSKQSKLDTISSSMLHGNRLCRCW